MDRSMHHARSVVLQFLFAWQLNPVSPETLTEEVAHYYPSLSPRQSAFVALTLNGIIRNCAALDAALSPYVKNWTLDRLAKIDLAILRFAAYELTFQPSTPPLVAVDEALKLSNEFSARVSYKFINGVLEAFINGNHINKGDSVHVKKSSS